MTTPEEITKRKAMKYLPRLRLLFHVSLVVAFTLVSASASTIIDFNNIPNGTLVSINNNYDGLLRIAAEDGLQWFDGVGSGFVWRESAIINGELVVGPLGNRLLPPAGTSAVQYYGRLTATFLSAVTGVSFDAYCYRQAGYQYSGFDKYGNPFSGGGSIPGIIDGGPNYPTGFVTFSPSIPTGGYLTELTIGNRDPRYGDASFWVDNIKYSPVPESSLGLLGLVTILALLLFERWSRRNGAGCCDNADSVDRGSGTA